MNEEHTKESLATKVLSRIRDEGVLPRPRWYFVLGNGAFWTLWGASVAVGAIAVAATIFSVRSIGWQFYAATHNTLFEFIVDSLPYVWVGILFVFIVLAYENMRHTKRGYRYPLWAIFAGSVVASLVLGVALFAIGVGRIADRGLGARLPSLSASHRAEERWVQPQAGLLAGDVVSVDAATETFVLRDFHAQEWRIDTRDLSVRDLEVIDTMDRVRVVGVPTATGASDGAFHACLVFPWDITAVLQKARELGGNRPLLSLVRRAMDERSQGSGRTGVCESVRSYQLLQGLRQN